MFPFLRHIALLPIEQHVFVSIGVRLCIPNVVQCVVHVVSGARYIANGKGLSRRKSYEVSIYLISYM